MKRELKLCELQKIVNAVLKEVKIKDYEYEDLYMEGLLIAHKALKDFNPKYGMKRSSYVYLRVYRNYISMYRLNKAQKRTAEQKIVLENTTLAENGAFYGKEAHELPQQEAKILKQELKDEINLMVEEILKQEEIRMLNLQLEGYTVEEIAFKYQLKPRQISNKLYYIKKKLKKNKDKFEKSRKML
ncbi:MAG: sigma-70 family RNA polymerase sigma factor [Mycoplasmatales bacterium]